jgi:error-prone DNA polymerase
VGKAIARVSRPAAAHDPVRSARLQPGVDEICPKCGCDDPSMLERLEGRGARAGAWFCNNCSHDWVPGGTRPRRFDSLDELMSRSGLRRDEIVTLADIGALNSFGYDRRSALWQAERAVRPAGALFETGAGDSLQERGFAESLVDTSVDPDAAAAQEEDSAICPLKPMTEAERLVADYAGTGLTVGRHPMALRRHELSMRGIMRAVDLRTARQGRRVRVGGMVITRQRPGTAKGFVFLTLEDETGISNIIIRPDLYATDRLTVVESSFLLVEGILQNQDGVTSIKAERMSKLDGMPDEAAIDSHDFH